MTTPFDMKRELEEALRLVKSGRHQEGLERAVHIISGLQPGIVTARLAKSAVAVFGEVYRALPREQKILILEMLYEKYPDEMIEVARDARSKNSKEEDDDG